MKADSRTMVFYYFQLDSNQEYNVTSLPESKGPIIVRDVLKVLPLDLSHGLYHFRFKSEVVDGDQKIVSWLDINNLAVKAPLVNGSIYIKILKIKENKHNKLFHVQKLIKAEVIKQAGQTQVPSAAVNIQVNTNNTQNTIQKPPVNNNKPAVNVSQPAKSSKEVNKQPQNKSPAQPAHSLSAPTHTAPSFSSNPKAENQVNRPTSDNSNLFQFDKEPQIKKPVTTTTKQNLQTFQNQFKQQQQNRQNERIAQIELQQKIRKWGYGSNKKINNTTTLLATLHQIWPQWQQVSLTSMLQPEQVAAMFKKAVIKVHPDKTRNRNFKDKYLSKRVFELLNESRKQ